MTRVLVTCIQMQELLPELGRELDAAGWELLVPTVTGQQLTEDELIALLPGVSGVIAGDDPFSRQVLSSAPDLKAISKWGIGVDAIDLQAASELGIRVARTPDVFGDEVADVAVCYTIGLARRVFEVDRAIRSGIWAKPRGVSLAGRRAALVGFGNIGQAIAQRLLACGMSVTGVDPSPVARSAMEVLGVAQAELGEAVDGADFLVLACPLTQSSRGMVDWSVLSRMAQDGYVVNVARGAILVEEDVLDALRTGRLAGAALDVFEAEPLPVGHPLIQMEQVILGSHNASNSYEAAANASLAAIANLKGLLEGCQE